MKRLFWAFAAAMMLIACDPIDPENKEDQEQTDPDNGDENGDENGGENEGGNDDGNDDGNEGGNEGGNDDGNEGGNDDGNDDGGETTGPLTPSDQKTKLASVGQKLLDKAPASEWEKYSQLIKDLNESVYFSGDYEFGSVTDWIDAEMNEAFSEDYELKVSGNKETESYIIELAILMSNHTGLFTFKEDGVTVSDYNGGTKAIIYLNDDVYEAEIKTSGKVTEAKYVYNDRYTWTSNGYWDDITGDYVEEEKIYEEIEKVTVTVGVPEQIDIYLKENGSSLGNLNVKLTPSLTNGGVDITTDSFSSQTTFSFNGFEVVSENIAYNGAKGTAEVKGTFKKNGENLFSIATSAKARLNEETRKWEDDYNSGEYTIITVEKADNINMSLDILGEIQAKGTCSDAVEAAESLDAMWEALYDGNKTITSDVKRHLDNFNAKIKIDVFYDGNNTKQASVEFDLGKIEYEYDYYYYDLIPIIVFTDGSKYKIEEFFTENAFGELVDNFLALCESFDELFGLSIEEENVPQPYANN